MTTSGTSTNLAVSPTAPTHTTGTSTIPNPYIKLLPHIPTPLAQFDINDVSSKSDFDYSSISSEDGSWYSEASESTPIARHTTTRLPSQQQPSHTPPSPEMKTSNSYESIQSILLSVHSELEALSTLTAQLQSNDAAVNMEIQSLTSQQEQIRSIASQTISTTVHHELHDCAAVLSVVGAPEPQHYPSSSLPTTASTSAASK